MDIPCNKVDLFNPSKGENRLFKLLEEIKAEIKSCDPETLLPTFYQFSRFLVQQKEEKLLLPILLGLMGLQKSLPDDFITNDQVIGKQLATTSPDLKTPEVQDPLVPRVVHEAISFMNKSLLAEQTITLPSLCIKVGTNPTTLVECFNQEMGISPIKYWKNLRLEKAAQLLVESRFSILEISLKCLYETPGNFSTAFRQKYNESPTEHRRKYGKRTV